MRLTRILLPLCLIMLPLSDSHAQVRQNTPGPLLSAHSTTLQNGAAHAGAGAATDPSALPSPVFEHLLTAFRNWHHYQLVPDATHADLIALLNQTADPDHRINLRIVNRSTGSTIWQRSVTLDPSHNPIANSNHSIDFLMLRLKRAVDHPRPDTNLTVP